MAKKNVKLPKGAIKKLAKAYAQLEQRRREEDAILALGPSLQALHEEKKKRRKRASSPVRRYRRYTAPAPAYSQYSKFVGPIQRTVSVLGERPSIEDDRPVKMRRLERPAGGDPDDMDFDF